LALTSKFTDRVSELFADFPVVVDGAICARNVRAHLSRARLVVGLIADEVYNEACNHGDAYHADVMLSDVASQEDDQITAWDDVKCEVKMLDAEGRRFTRAFARRLSDVEEIYDRAVDEGWLVSPLSAIEASRVRKSADKPCAGVGAAIKRSATTPVRAAPSDQSAHDREDEGPAEFVAELNAGAD
jgi:hypothetical protein